MVTDLKPSVDHRLWDIVVSSIFLLSLALSTDAAMPDPPKGIRVMDVTASSVKLMWDPDTSPEPARFYTIEYRNQSRTKFDMFKSNIKTNVFTVTSLKAHTAYSFQVVAENVVGRSRPSKMVEVTTGELGQ